ncbi:MAG: hypothetical protein ACREEM_24150 [Blastocatellia bacterium]
MKNLVLHLRNTRALLGIFSQSPAFFFLTDIFLAAYLLAKRNGVLHELAIALNVFYVHAP